MGSQSKKIGKHQTTWRGPLPTWRLDWALTVDSADPRTNRFNRVQRRTAQALLRHHVRCLTRENRQLLRSTDVPEWVSRLLAPFSRFLKYRKGRIR